MYNRCKNKKMSVIRIYGSTIVNLTKAISISKASSNKFVFPISNYSSGGSAWASDVQNYNFTFDSYEKRDKEYR